MFHHVAPSEVLPERSTRAAFKYPVRVTIAGARVVRVLAGDISPNGMFLCMTDPPEAGTCVALAFEAGGKVLPFAEGEVAWCRREAKGGFGVRFTRFVHPRAKALVDFLCENVEGGSALKIRPTPPGRRRWSGFAALAAALALFVASQAEMKAPEPLLDPSAVCRHEAAPPPPAEVTVAAPAPRPAPVRRAPRLAESPKPAPALTRTVSAPARPAPFSSTPIPSGAARLVTVSRVGGALRLSVDAVATGHVRAATLVSPTRLVVDVTGIPPIAEHALPLADPELRRLVASAHGRETRLTVELTRAPSSVTRQGDSVLVRY